MSSETTRYFQLHLYHAQISFCEIISKRNREIIHEGKYLIGMFLQPVKQIFTGRLCEFTPLTRCSFLGGDRTAYPCRIIRILPEQRAGQKEWSGFMAGIDIQYGPIFGSIRSYQTYTPLKSIDWFIKAEGLCDGEQCTVQKRGPL